MPIDDGQQSYVIAPDLDRTGLTRAVTGIGPDGVEITLNVVEERPLTIFLNSRAIVTAMTIGDYPEYLALGFLANQRMLQPDDVVTGIEYDADLDVVVVRTLVETDHEAKLARKGLKVEILVTAAY